MKMNLVQPNLAFDLLENICYCSYGYCSLYYQDEQYTKVQSSIRGFQMMS